MKEHEHNWATFPQLTNPVCLECGEYAPYELDRFVTWKEDRKKWKEARKKWKEARKKAIGETVAKTIRLPQRYWDALQEQSEGTYGDRGTYTGGIRALVDAAVMAELAKHAQRVHEEAVADYEEAVEVMLDG